MAKSWIALQLLGGIAVVFVLSAVGKLGLWAPAPSENSNQEMSQLRAEVHALRKEVANLRHSVASSNAIPEQSSQIPQHPEQVSQISSQAESLPAASLQSPAVGNPPIGSDRSVLDGIRLKKSPTLEDEHVAGYCKRVLDFVSANPDDEAGLFSLAKESRLKDQSKKVFQGQKLADVFFYSALWKHLDRPGVYVDLASNDYRHISNTYFADHCLGFRGLCIEANSKYWPNLDQRRHCAVIKTCISDEPREIEFVMDGAMGGISDQFKGKVNGAKKVHMKCDTLSRVFQQYKIKHVDYMNLDVEGVELACLQGIDWNSVRIDVIAVERNPKFAPLKQFLLAKSYVETVDLVHDTVFIHSKAEQALAALSVWKRRHCAKVNDVTQAPTCGKPGCKLVNKC